MISGFESFRIHEEAGYCEQLEGVSNEVQMRRL